MQLLTQAVLKHLGIPELGQDTVAAGKIFCQQ